jgi:CRP-like cAMP-binding protein
LAPEYVSHICEQAEIESYAKGKIVFKRGKELPKLYFLLEGRVKLVDANFESREVNKDSEESGYALNELNPSKESAVAVENVRVLLLDRKALDLIMAASQSKDEIPVESESGNDDSEFVTAQINYLDAYYPQPAVLDSEASDWMSKLLDSPLFSSISPGNIQQLFARFEEVDLTAGDVIFEADDEGDYFYVLSSGNARIFPQSSMEAIDLAIGDYFGEESLVGDTTRNATVAMTTSGSIMRLSKEDFVELLQEPLFKYIEREQIDEFGPQVQLLDVRLPIEHRHFRVQGARNIALAKLRDSLDKLDPGYTYVVTDDAGCRSKVAVQLLLQKGLSAVILNQSSQCYQ